MFCTYCCSLAGDSVRLSEGAALSYRGLPSRGLSWDLWMYPSVWSGPSGRLDKTQSSQDKTRANTSGMLGAGWPADSVDGGNVSSRLVVEFISCLLFPMFCYVNFDSVYGNKWHIRCPHSTAKVLRNGNSLRITSYVPQTFDPDCPFHHHPVLSVQRQHGCQFIYFCGCMGTRNAHTGTCHCSLGNHKCLPDAPMILTISAPTILLNTKKCK